MNTTTATYSISVTTDEDTGHCHFENNAHTSKDTKRRFKSHNTKLTNYAMKQYPNWKEIDVKLHTMSNIKDVTDSPEDWQDFWENEDKNEEFRD